ncbi:MAG: endo-1,4-beta-xylanase [Alphaproteobacteria bacterium]|nr:endo-1,4-beta-xylanase [Alphaproteobacteria bacterium]
MTSRRAFIAGALSAPVLMRLGGLAFAAPLPRLGDLAKQKGLFFGAAITSEQVTAADGYAALLADQCGAYVAEWESKWGAIEWVRGHREYDSVDTIVAAAKSGGKMLRGHTLLWHFQLPPWADDAVLGSSGAWDELVAPFIFETAKRYAGDIAQWDVVNEVIEPEWQEPDGLRVTPFLAMRGRGYIADAFHLAAAAAPDARLYINEYDLCYAEDDQEKRRAAMLALLERLIADGVPVHGLGLQTHLKIGRTFDASRYRAFLDDVAGLGLDLAITELDVGEGPDPKGDTATRDRRNADEVRKVLEVAFEQKRLTGIVTWSLGDAVSYTRVSGESPDNRGLPFDEFLAPTAMHATLADLFAQADQRSAASS